MKPKVRYRSDGYLFLLPAPSMIVGRDVTERFKFSEAEWKKIAPTLPPGCAQNPDVVRSAIQLAAEAYSMTWPSRPRQRAKEWDEIAEICLDLAKRIRNARTNQRFLEAFAITCEDVAAEVPDNAINYRQLAIASRGRRNPDRERLYARITDIWVHNGGKLRRSRAADTGAPQGPAVRFFAAVLSAIMKENAPKPETIIDIIKRQIGRYDIVAT